jgi:acetylornithine/succinyldiaminopimelate/putrescine aminotransferase
MQETAFDRIVDAVDIETVLLCTSETEAKALALALLRELGFKKGDIIALDFTGSSARVRLRGNVFKPGERYSWKA